MPVPRPTLAVSRAHVAIPAFIVAFILLAIPAVAGVGEPPGTVSAASTGEAVTASLHSPDFNEQLDAAIDEAEAARAAWFAGVARAEREARHQAELAAQAEAARVEAAKAPPEPRRAPVYESTGSVWDRLAQCESGGNWAINTGNGYYGGLQMDMQFWSSYGGPAFASRPDLASRAQQITVAERARDSGRGYYPWPTCARNLGLI